MNVILILIVLIVILRVLIAINKKKKKRKKTSKQEDFRYYKEEKETSEQNNAKYQRQNIMTNCEKEFYIKLNQVFGKKYIIQPQIPLSSIINKLKKDGEYQNELYRTVDFGIFNNEMELLCLIELNDKTHLQEDRILRDFKVKKILEQAKIPLITFWTNEKLTNEYIKNKIKGVIN